MQGRIPKSYHIIEDQIIIDNYHTRPAIKTLQENHPYNPETCHGFDIRKSYATAVMTMEDNYPSFSICDAFEEYKGEDIVIGEYLIDDVTIAQLGGFEIPKQVIGHNEAKFLLERKYIEKKDILFVKKASYYIEAKCFAKFIGFLKNTFDESTFKTLANYFIGQLGKRFNTKDKAFITNDWETVCGSFNVHAKGSNQWTCKSIDDLHFIKVSEKQRIFGECSQIFRQIVSQGRIQLMKLLAHVCDPKQSMLVGYNTDSVFVDKPKRLLTRNDNDIYKAEKWKPKKYNFQEQERVPISIATKREWQMVNHKTTPKEELAKESLVCVGGGGCGKSELLIELNKLSDIPTIVLAYTNKACNNLRKRGLQNVYTFSSYFKENEFISDSIERIQIDEYSMIPSSWIKLLYKLKME
jgi:hypothetical protein